MEALSEQRGSLVLRLRVQPKASRNALEPAPDGGVRAAVTAPPSGGKANAAVCALVAKTLGLPKRSVHVVKGETSRDKALALEGIALEDARRILMHATKRLPADKNAG